jgi:hypothetical protein
VRKLALCVCLGLAGVAAWGQQAAGGGKCGELAQLTLPHTAILSAVVTEPGKPGGLDADQAKDPVFAKLPAFCKVTVESHPSADSKIAIEVWLPIQNSNSQGWNRKFLGYGNGGFAGQIDLHHMALALMAGYATAGTDTGHRASGIDAAWALGHPEKIADFGWRGVHEMSLTAPAVVQAFYGHAADHRYFDACSDGGREALMEAERFPADYDGIVAGAPAYNWTHLVSSGLWIVQDLERKPESYIPAAKVPAIDKAVRAQCDTSGQGFLDDPRQCHFDPSALLCKGGDNKSCLTAVQVTALSAVYAGAHAKDGAAVDFSFLPGAEDGGGGWALWVTGQERGKGLADAFVSGYFANMVYGKADLDALTLDPDAAFKLAAAKTSEMLDAMNPDLSAFAAHGGKLILYHGWNDPAIPALGTVDFFNRVTAELGEEKTAGFVRLFMVPGMQHCAGGPGATDFGQGGPADNAALDNPGHNVYRALEAWVENGAAPERIVARHSGEKGAAGFSRPLCAWPHAARYSGTGDRNDAANYTCAVTK